MANSSGVIEDHDGIGGVELAYYDWDEVLRNIDRADSRSGLGIVISQIRCKRTWQDVILKGGKVTEVKFALHRQNQHILQLDIKRANEAAALAEEQIDALR